MHFRGLSDVRSLTSGSHSGPGSVHPAFPLSRLSRLVRSVRVLRAAPLIGIGGALGLFAASRLASQVSNALGAQMP
jgi:hypothetical protein